MSFSMAKKKAYVERTDVDKIKSQWTKLSGLHEREEWSAAVVRAATAAEIAVNLAIRAELAERGVTDKDVTDVMLKAANGLRGKFIHLLKPLAKGRDRKQELEKLWKVADKINNSRNEIVHSGLFRSGKDAEKIIEQCRAFVVPLVRIYQADFELKAPKDRSTKPNQ